MPALIRDLEVFLSESAIQSLLFSQASHFKAQFLSTDKHLSTPPGSRQYGSDEGTEATLVSVVRCMLTHRSPVGHSVQLHSAHNLQTLACRCAAFAMFTPARESRIWSQPPSPQTESTSRRPGMSPALLKLKLRFRAGNGTIHAEDAAMGKQGISGPLREHCQFSEGRPLIKISCRCDAYLPSSYYAGVSQCQRLKSTPGRLAADVDVHSVLIPPHR
jgi:hypothetical protein